MIFTRHAKDFYDGDFVVYDSICFNFAAQRLEYLMCSVIVATEPLDVSAATDKLTYEFDHFTGRIDVVVAEMCGADIDVLTKE